MAELVHKYLDNDLVRVVNGGVPETTKLLELKWDHSTWRFPSPETPNAN
jgi:aldehyde dehydrogenase (NAD+)/aldehyde dehydrogenase (NAD(P)+)